MCLSFNETPMSTLFHWVLYFVAAAAKSLQSCPTLCDPIDGSHQAPPSLEFTRQEYWSGLPLPSPMHESEKWKLSRSVVSDPQRPHGLQPSRLLYPWDFPGRSTGVGCHCLLRLSCYTHVNVKWMICDPKGNQSSIFIGRTDAEAETLILWQPDVKNWPLGKDPDAGKDWRWE